MRVADSRFIDLAYLFTLELHLITPKRITLSLAGQPQKPGSAKRLQALLAAGALQTKATQHEIYDQLEKRGNVAGERGVFVVTLATHGFNDQGADFLVAADSLRRRIERTGIAVNEIFDDVTRASAPRRLLFLDACRERLSADTRKGGADPDSMMSEGLAKAIANTSGQVILAGTTLGGYAYDDFVSMNGVFTAAIIDGLRGRAVPDKYNFITARALADYVNQHVLDWVRRNRPEHVQLSQGITITTGGPAAEIPLAMVSASTFEIPPSSTATTSLSSCKSESQPGYLRRRKALVIGNGAYEVHTSGAWVKIPSVGGVSMIIKSN